MTLATDDGREFDETTAVFSYPRLGSINDVCVCCFGTGLHLHTANEHGTNEHGTNEHGTNDPVRSDYLRRGG